MQIKVVNQSGNVLPAYQTEFSSGLDLMAQLSAPFTLLPLQRALISTGLFIELPEGYEAQIRPRSGLALKYGITVLNSPGTIDSDYRGEIKVLLINQSDTPCVIHPGDRIAQMVVAKFTRIEWENVSSLSETERGEGGYGSTGK